MEPKNREGGIAPPFLPPEDGERQLMIPWLRYGETFAKINGDWLFAERKLYVDWAQTRPSHP